MSTEELSAMSKPHVPKNTEKTTKWALSNLKEWFQELQCEKPGEQVSRWGFDSLLFEGNDKQVDGGFH